jgi:alpha-tubulin suppressor-like RCC1 family protein
MFRSIFVLLALASLYAAPAFAQFGGPFGHMCVSSPTTANFAYCWGAAENGKLGNGTTTPNQLQPNIVRGTFGAWHDWTMISTGNQATCGIRGGEVYCWGLAANGRLGNGTTTPNQTTPSLVLGGWSDWTQIAAATDNHACGIRSGQAYCWGVPFEGQLGNGTTSGSRSSPSMVLGGWSDWTRIAVGLSFTCGIRAGQAYCWGRAANGRLGNGTVTPNRTTPSLVEGGWSDWTDISLGFDHACGIRGGQAYCWGLAANGRLGNGTTTPDQTTPSLVLGGWSDWTSISAGRFHTCGVRAGQGYCWGGAANGRLGNGTTTPDQTTPSLVLGGWSDWTQISAARSEYSCGIRAGQAYCWGAWSNGQLGHGSGTQDRLSPTLVLNALPNVLQIGAGGNHSCALVSQTITLGC